MWLAIRLPLLPLESLSTSFSQTENKALAIIEDERILMANKTATAQGISPGQSLSTAYALCDEIQLLARNLRQEHQLVENLAMALYQFSSTLYLEPDGLLVIEIGRSLKLFNGLKALIEKISLCLIQQEVAYQIALGHTPKAAEILTYRPLDDSLQCYDQAEEKIKPEKIEQQLGQLEVELMAVSKTVIDKLHSVGIKNLAALKALPINAIHKRFGAALSLYLRQLFNQIADPGKAYSPRQDFHQKLEFIDVIHHRNGLAFPIKRLLESLCRFLTLRQKNCQNLRWQLFDSEKNVIGFEVLISDPQINLAVYLELTRLNLERYSLHAPVEAISLTADRLFELNAPNQQLFEAPEGFQQSPHFINKIRAKLGSQSCRQIVYQQTHVPELAHKMVAEVNPAYLSHAPMQAQQPPVKSEAIEQGSAALALPLATPARPAWLLEKPQLISFNQRKLVYRGEMQIISAQEKITHYWWKKKIARDYFLAEHDDGTIYWVFYDQIKKQWYLHGLYS